MEIYRQRENKFKKGWWFYVNMDFIYKAEKGLYNFFEKNLQAMTDRIPIMCACFYEDFYSFV